MATFKKFNKDKRPKRNTQSLLFKRKRFCRFTVTGVEEIDYKDINLLGFKMLRPGGLLFTFSCSGGVPMDLFQSIVAGAALDAGVNAKIIKRLGAAALYHEIEAIDYALRLAEVKRRR